MKSARYLGTKQAVFRQAMVAWLIYSMAVILFATIALLFSRFLHDKELVIAIAVGLVSPLVIAAHLFMKRGDYRFRFRLRLPQGEYLWAPLLFYFADQPQVRTLFLPADSTEATRLRLEMEYRLVNQIIRQSSQRRLVTELQKKDLLVDTRLLQHKYNIIHISGHGAEREIAATGERRISHRTLMELYSMREKPRLVILNACYEEQQAQAIAEIADYVIGIESVIGVEGSASDTVMVRFVTALYDALFHGKEVETAFKIARAQIALEGLERQIRLKFLTRKRHPIHALDKT